MLCSPFNLQSVFHASANGIDRPLFAGQTVYRTIEHFSWRCSSCSRDCIPIRSESRCLCGHRLKEHSRQASGNHRYALYTSNQAMYNIKDSSCSRWFLWITTALESTRTHIRTMQRRCTHAKCCCKAFFFIPAEGSWILKCRCKHRHTDHNPITHACSKPGCKCMQFGSPWVCNCDHPWTQHCQVCAVSPSLHVGWSAVSQTQCMTLHVGWSAVSQARCLTG